MKTKPTPRKPSRRRPTRQALRAKLRRTDTEPAGRVIEMVPLTLRLKRILVPTDFSKPAAKAVRYAVSFAQQFGAKISLIHVRAVPYFAGDLAGLPGMMPLPEPPESDVLKNLEAVAERLVPASLRGRSIVRIGSGFDEICRAAKSTRADLIIVATHGHTGLKHVLLGSTAERIVRHAPCPVLVVREREHEFA